MSEAHITENLIEQNGRLRQERDRLRTDLDLTAYSAKLQKEVADILMLEEGDEPDEWFVPAEPEPQGPYTFLEAIGQREAIEEKFQAQDAAKLVQVVVERLEVIFNEFMCMRMDALQVDNNIRQLASSENVAEMVKEAQNKK